MALQKVIKRPHITLQGLSYLLEVKKILINYSLEVVFAVETAIKYEGYENRERKRILKSIPNRIKFLDEMNFKTDPMVCEKWKKFS